MIHRRLQVDERLVHQLSHGREVGFGKVVGEVFAVREGPDTKSVAIGREHGNALTDMLRGRAVHHGPQPGLELPGALARGDDERRSTEPGHSRLHRRQRAQ